MKKILLKISLITSIIGICSLFVIFLFSDVEQVEALDIIYQEDNSVVKIKGFVSDISVRKNITFLKIDMPFNAIVFDNVNFSKGDLLELSGSITEYKDEKELIVDKIIR